MWDGFDQRKFPRLSRHCNIWIDLEASSTKPILTMTENIGAGGVCVVLNKELKRFSECRLSVELDKKLPRVKCKGKVVWIVPTAKSGSTKKKYDTGIEFQEMQPPVGEMLREYLKGLA